MALQVKQRGGLAIGKVLQVTLSGAIFLEPGKANWVLASRACHIIAHTFQIVMFVDFQHYN